MPYQARELFVQEDQKMTRTRCIHKLLYAGVVVLCIVSCWNARLLYTAKDDTVPARHAEFVKQVLGQRDTLFDTVKILKQKCTSDQIQDGSHRKRIVPSRNASCEKPQLWTKPKQVDLDKALVLGYRRKEPGFLTIGIPTVQRESEHYLTQTLDSLIDNSTPVQRSEVTLLIFLADFEEEKRHVLKTMLMDQYLNHLENGFIQVIQANPLFYPPLQNLKSNYGDSQERVRWRSKQCADFSFMFLYAASLSEYYMQIEDDVVTTSGYLSAIDQYIQEKANVNWITLEFSILGFIGKLFHSYDLDRLAQFVMFFYEDQPVDFLYKYFNVLNGQQETYVRLPSLFQHKGKQSTLKDKESTLEDKFFEPDVRQYQDSDNPPGKVYSDMKPFGMYLPQLCYNPEPGFFWAVTPHEGESVVLVFDVPKVISRVAIATGSDKHPTDILEGAAIELGSMVLHEGSTGSLPDCGGYTEVGRFAKGNADINIWETFTGEVACLRIRVLQSQEQWAVIREIAVWTSH